VEEIEQQRHSAIARRCLRKRHFKTFPCHKCGSTLPKPQCSCN